VTTVNPWGGVVPRSAYRLGFCAVREKYPVDISSQVHDAGVTADHLPVLLNLQGWKELADCHAMSASVSGLKLAIVSCYKWV